MEYAFSIEVVAMTEEVLDKLIVKDLWKIVYSHVHWSSGIWELISEHIQIPSWREDDEGKRYCKKEVKELQHKRTTVSEIQRYLML